MKKYSKPPWHWRTNTHDFNYILMSGTNCILEPLYAEDDENCSAGDVLHVNVNGIMRPLYPEHPDAKLIAATPELYEALKQSLQYIPRDEPYLDEFYQSVRNLLKRLEDDDAKDS